MHFFLSLGMEVLKWSLFASPILKATQSNNLSKLREAVQRYPHIDEQESEHGQTALMIAASAGYDACCRELLARGANVCVRNKIGKTALMLAVCGGHEECVRALLRHQPEKQLLIKDKAGKTARDYCLPKHVGIAALLRSAEAALEKPRWNLMDPRPSGGTVGHSGVLPNPATAAAGSVSASHTHGPGLNRSALPSHSFPVAHASPFPSVYPPNPDAAYNYVLRPPAPPVPSSCSSTPTAPSAPGWGSPRSTESGSTPKGSAAAAPTAPPVPATAGWVSPGSPAPGFTTGGAAGPGFTTAGGAPGPILNAVGSGGSGDMLGPSVVWPAPQPGSPHYPSISPISSTFMRPPAQAAADAAVMEGRWPAAQMGMASVPQQQPQLQQCHSAHQGAVTPDRVLGRVYSKLDLDIATGSFSPLHKIGGGGFGTVYKGMLDGIPVAIKVMDSSPEAMQGLKEFTQEMDILSRLHHPHIVLLIGACLDASMPSLVYELAEGGSLEDIMFKPGTDPRVLNWEDRVRIAAEVAAALLFLHSSQPPVAHMDIKPGNILLSKDRTAKLGDVGLSRILRRPAHLPPGVPAPSTAQASQLVGTLTYVDPEYMRTGEYSTKSDVYALGVVMLQLLTSHDKNSLISFVERARDDARHDPARFSQAIDPSIRHSWPAMEALAFADLALQCVEFRRKDRPDLRTTILPTLVQLRNRASMYHSGQPQQPTATTVSMPGGQNIAVPTMFICPITQEILQNPVVAADGFTYEESAIKAWIERSATSPMTNLSLPHTSLTPNHNLRSALNEWLLCGNMSKQCTT